MVLQYYQCLKSNGAKNADRQKRYYGMYKHSRHQRQKNKSRWLIKLYCFERVETIQETVMMSSFKFLIMVYVVRIILFNIYVLNMLAG